MAYLFFLPLLIFTYHLLFFCCMRIWEESVVQNFEMKFTQLEKYWIFTKNNLILRQMNKIDRLRDISDLILIFFSPYPWSELLIYYSPIFFAFSITIQGNVKLFCLICLGWSNAINGSWVTSILFIKLLDF